MSYTVQPLTALRKVIAARMVDAKQTVPHFRLLAELKADRFVALRETLRRERPQERLTVNDLLIKACASALMDVPAMNVQWAGKELHCFDTADISVVTAIEGGLSTPILRSAEKLSVWEISAAVKTLAARAAAKSLRMDEVSGGTFSISNLGMFGVDQFDAIINPPQCAILAVGRLRPGVVLQEGVAAPATLLTVTLSADHRAIDGAIAAKFLAVLRRNVEEAHGLSPSAQVLG